MAPVGAFAAVSAYSDVADAPEACLCARMAADTPWWRLSAFFAAVAAVMWLKPYAVTGARAGQTKGFPEATAPAAAISTLWRVQVDAVLIHGHRRCGSACCWVAIHRVVWAGVSRRRSQWAQPSHAQHLCIKDSPHRPHCPVGIFAGGLGRRSFLKASRGCAITRTSQCRRCELDGVEVYCFEAR